MRISSTTSFARMILLLAVAICGAAAWGAPSGQDPYAGYVYPAGGQQGTVFQVTIRGQRLRGASEVYFSGQGVHASVANYEGPGGPLNKLQQEALKQRLQELRDTRFGGRSAGKKQGKAKAGKAADSTDAAKPQQNVTLPDIPELRDLEHKTPKQLMAIANRYLNPAKRTKPPMAELLSLEVTIDKNAAPGDRELRVLAATGLTNPLVFQVGQIPEIRERDKDADDTAATGPSSPPAVLNGQIMPGEVDKFPLQLKAGQKIVVAAQARKLIPYLADAVPGWFQAVVELYDADGKQLACDDDCGYDPDPAFIFQVPRDGRYTLEIRDSIYRGREDFVYRVDVADVSLLKSLFPMGSRGGVPLGASRLDPDTVSKLVQSHFSLADNPMPRVNEVEPNETGQTSMPVKLPCVLGGVIGKPGDKDVFSIEGRAGEQVVAEVYARRMGSPLDSLLRLIDTSGHVVAFNDDFKDPEMGLLTNQSDSYLIAKLPANGRYFVQLTDAESHGGPEFAYALRVSPPQPDFALRVTPSSLNMRAGRAVPITVSVVRKDGWDGDIEIALKDAPNGFAINGAVIPKGRDRVQMTLEAPRNKSNQPIALKLEGRARIGGKTITRPVVPAEDMEQAFAYHHLVPSTQLLAVVGPGGLISPSLDMAKGDRLIIPAGGSAQVTFLMRAPKGGNALQLVLNDPPAGVTLGDMKMTPRGVSVTIKADDKHIGYADNLILEAFANVDPKGNGQKQRVSAGVLPAVPFEIVQR